MPSTTTSRLVIIIIIIFVAFQFPVISRISWSSVMAWLSDVAVECVAITYWNRRCAHGIICSDAMCDGSLY